MSGRLLMLVRLTKKLAEVVNGVDLTHCSEGDVIDLPERFAELLLAERWAVVVLHPEVPNHAPKLQPDDRAVAADRGGPGLRRAKSHPRARRVRR